MKRENWFYIFGGMLVAAWTIVLLLEVAFPGGIEEIQGTEQEKAIAKDFNEAIREGVDSGKVYEDLDWSWLNKNCYTVSKLKHKGMLEA